ncbi:MAG: hypothetical protein DWH74_03875 [Planctomycetota bacterium]|nr:MAG: hypothetical protein DWH74_03875 [Planctomycetota bacterium]
MSDHLHATASDARTPAMHAASTDSDSSVRRLLVLFVSIALAVTAFRAVQPFMGSGRGVIGPLVSDAERPLMAGIAILLAFAVVSAVSALVGRLVNAIVGLFVLGTGVGYLAMRAGSSADFCFGGSSMFAAGIELIGWTVLVAAGSHLIFRVGGPLMDVPKTTEDHIDSPIGPSARIAWLAAIAGVALAWLAAVTMSKGQAIGAATLAGFATGAIGRMLSPRTTPVYLAAAPVAAFALVYLFLGFSAPADLSVAFADGSLPRLARLMPVDIVAGALCGTALGFGFMRSFAQPNDSSYAR